MRREGEEGAKRKDSSLSLHMLSVALAKGVWCCYSVCVYMKGGDAAGSGWVFDSIPLPPSSGITRCLYCIFAPHDLQIFSF